jgi:hypothetical protein
MNNLYIIVAVIFLIVLHIEDSKHKITYENILKEVKGEL